MKQAGGYTPAVSRTLSVGENTGVVLTPKSRTKMLTKKCLERDGYRCVISGRLDLEEASRRYPDFRLAPAWDREHTPEYLVGAHIIPHALGSASANANVREIEALLCFSFGFITN